MAVYDWFYKTIVASQESIPVQPLWGVSITNIPSFTEVSSYETGWDVGAGNKVASGYTHSKGVMAFAQGVKIPGEGLNVGRTGPENTGILRGLIGEGRRDLENLSISFIETNTSFTDFVLRPWAVLISHRSLKDVSLKTAITVTHFKKTPGGFIPRRVFNFYNAAPVNVNSEDYTYGDNKITIRQVEFAYERYELSGPGGGGGTGGSSNSSGGGRSQQSVAGSSGFSGGSQAGFSGGSQAGFSGRNSTF